jgi:spore maturation protein CgeB
MNVLFLGSNFGNGHLQFLTLKRLYQNLEIIDPSCGIGRNRYISYIFHKISPKIFEPIINAYANAKIKNNYDLIFVKSGEYIGKNLIINLKKKTKKIIYYCNDNPFVQRDKKRWDLFHSASKFYDLLVFHDKSRLSEAKKRGLKNIAIVVPPYDKNVHKKTNLKKKNKDIVFVGTWSEQKGNLINKLIKLGLNIKIYGSNWKKDKNFHSIKRFITTGHLKYSNYTRIIRSSKIAIALYSNENKDSINPRSIEIAAIGTFMLSKKTSTMTKLFKENKEVVFFKTPQECYHKCNFYILNSKKREIIAKNGYDKVTKHLSVSNEDLIKKIVKIVFN